MFCIVVHSLSGRADHSAVDGQINAAGRRASL
jgi:hypothetical protein